MIFVDILSRSTIDHLSTGKILQRAASNRWGGDEKNGLEKVWGHHSKHTKAGRNTVAI
jgi:hypothetical protein